MSLRIYFLLMTLTTALCWAAWGLVISTINPFSAGLIGFLLFYGILFLALVGTFLILGFGVRVVIKPQEIVMRHIRSSLRQGILLSLLVIAVLLLQSQRYLFWWNIVLIVALLVFLEILFLSFRRNTA